jgi:glycine/D-amino acid oxidase-like deaminating enzyme
MSSNEAQHHVIVVGGGFAGIACARRLSEDDSVHVTLIDRNNYHQFQPLLYQVATSQLSSSDIAYSLRKRSHDRGPSWGWDYFGKSHGPQVLDRSDAARIDWGDDADAESPASADERGGAAVGAGSGA